MSRRLVLAALLCVASACSEGPTQVVVTIDAESTYSDAATDLRVVVRGAAGDSDVFDAPSRDVTLPFGPSRTHAFPIDVTIAPRDGDTARRWSVEATATTIDGAHVATVRARGRYVAGRTARVELLLENACDNVACTAEQTCAAGACVAIPDEGPFVDDGGVDAGATDAGLDAGLDGGVDAGVIRMCPGSTPYVPDPGADSLGYGGTPSATYPTLVQCNNVHSAGQLCNPSVPSDGVCFRQALHEAVSFCRTPCAPVDENGGITAIQAVCSAIHPDSRCAHLQGFNTDPDDWYCTIACNPFDNVGCRAGTQCVVYEDSGGDSIVTDCVPIPTNPGYQDTLCASDGTDQVWPGGCAPGYACRYDEICGGPTQGPACLQLCDPAPVGSTLVCPVGTQCLVTPHATRTIGAREYAFCYEP